MNTTGELSWVSGMLTWLITGISLVTPQLRPLATPALKAQAQIAYYREVQRLQTAWAAHRDQVPDGLNERGWEEVHQTVSIAIANVCFSPSHADWRAVRTLREALTEQLEHDPSVSLETAVGMWEGLAKTGPHGAQYIERMQPMFEEALKFAQQ